MFSFISLDNSPPDESQPPLKISQPVSAADKSDVHTSPSYMNVNYNDGFRSDNEDVLLSTDLNWNRCIKYQSILANIFFAVYSKASLFNCRLSAWRIQKLFREQQQFFQVTFDYCNLSVSVRGWSHISVVSEALYCKPATCFICTRSNWNTSIAHADLQSKYVIMSL